MIHTQLKEDLKAAMRARDQVRLMSIRSVLALATAELVQKKSNAEFLDDEGIIALIRRGVKQRRDSIEQFVKGNREDLASNERAELTVLEGYLPALMNKEEIKKIAEAKKTALGITDKTKANMLMGALMKELKGKADGMDVKEVVEGLF
ncbi:MAG: GatB/YqeY domain-containing protein [Candidatus Taylorbacteria bacterium]|nr:GatB/YqeY domain-containing protein [Candidatus Taylorbacteria bacterium]